MQQHLQELANIARGIHGIHWLSQSGAMGLAIVDLRSYRWLKTMIFTVEEINQDPILLPNVTLGYLVADTCLAEGTTLSAALTLVTGQEETVSGAECNGAPMVPVIIGDARSSASIVVADTLGVFDIPMVSYFASCACLSDSRRFHSFMRTVPSDAFQAKAMARLLRLLDWTWVGVVAGDDEYGKSGSQLLLKELEGTGVCVDYVEVIPKSHSHSRIRRIVERIQSSTAHVVVTFAIGPDLEVVFKEMEVQNVTNRQWIATEAWSTSIQYSVPASIPLLAGTIGFALRRADIQGLGAFLAQLSPVKQPNEAFVKDVWEEIFGCSLAQDWQPSSKTPKCTGSENVEKHGRIYTDVSQLRVTYNVYKAVYAIANAIHNMMTCQPGRGLFEDGECPDVTRIKPRQLLHYLNAVNFTTPVGELVYFEDNGEPSASYDIMNWHVDKSGAVNFVQVGQFDAAKGPGQELNINLEKVIWGGGWADQPAPWNCMLRHTLFGVSFVICIACVLSKTVVVLVAFRATLPGSNLMQYFGPIQQRAGIFLCTLVQVVICLLWLLLAPPLPTESAGSELGARVILQCTVGSVVGVNLRSYRWLKTMIFTVEEINQDPALLPNVTLGYLVADSCLAEGTTLSAALALVTGQEETMSGAECSGAPLVPVIIGDARSSASIVVADTLGVFDIPMVSYFASCACLSDSRRFHSFLRTVPSDVFQAKAMARLLRLLDWTWVGVVAGDDEYGKSGVQLLLKELENAGICVDYLEFIPKSYSQSRIRRIVERIQSSTAIVVVTFAIVPDIKVLLKEVVVQNVTNKQWIATEAWSTSILFFDPAIRSLLSGTIGFALRRADIKGLGSFLAQLSPVKQPNEPFVKDVWEEIFGCSLAQDWQPLSKIPKCTGLENVEKYGRIYTDVSQLRVTYNVYKAVYAIANAIHNMMACQPGRGLFEDGECPDVTQIKPQQLLHYLNAVNFTTPVVFIGRPAPWNCMLRHTLFGVSFVICIACVLSKTVVVLVAFRATLPGSNLMQYFGPIQQRVGIFICTLVQVVICLFWLLLAPPLPTESAGAELGARVILQCTVGSVVGFVLVLGYIGLLAVVCFLLAFFARKLPDNFNEAQFITFSMLIFCAVWIAFVPAYISSPGKYTVAVEVFAILASSYGLLLCIFTPKCYIILLKPEKNTKKNMIAR
ncbi:extracellular calcium-sensing receptor-like protein [Labeo rohita]|uniref:Extracellular calcium-sensing receptor-like protein n=1 Tax=Labeo rohita TaxID=84645 RepID=A0A498LD81_LABRO|nr:extracellular calcium-sensing receptor-like protein [Labeo rohita]